MRPGGRRAGFTEASFRSSALAEGIRRGNILRSSFRMREHSENQGNRMSKLEELQPNAAVRGILPDCVATIVNVQWFGSEALELTYKDPAGRVANCLMYRDDEARLEIVDQG